MANEVVFKPGDKVKVDPVKRKAYSPLGEFVVKGVQDAPVNRNWRSQLIAIEVDGATRWLSGWWLLKVA